MGFIKPIKDPAYLKELIEKGYVLKGPMRGPTKNLSAIERSLRKGSEFAPEDWLLEMGYQFVEPSPFTKGFKLAYKLINGIPEQYFKSVYSLMKKGNEIPIYVKHKK